MANIVDIPANGGYSLLAGYGFCDAAGPDLPPDGAKGYAHGCLFRKTNGSAASDALYLNIGNFESANFDLLTGSPTTLTVPIPLTQFRVWDALQTNLPGTAADDDLGLVTGTFGTGAPYLRTVDFKASTALAYGRTQITVPPHYIAGAPITLEIDAGMLTTISDSGGSVLVNAAVYRAAAPSVNICATAAQGANSLTVATKTFTITSTNITPGELLDVRISHGGEDAATATAVIGIITGVRFKFAGQP
jgi:hypothetical protein